MMVETLIKVRKPPSLTILWAISSKISDFVDTVTTHTTKIRIVVMLQAVLKDGLAYIKVNSGAYDDACKPTYHPNFHPSNQAHAKTYPHDSHCIP